MQESGARRSDRSAQPGGIHLVYSHEWSPARRQIVAGKHHERVVVPMLRKGGKRRRAQQEHNKVVKLGLGAAALSGPLVWAGHALLHWARFL